MKWNTGNWGCLQNERDKTKINGEVNECKTETLNDYSNGSFWSFLQWDRFQYDTELTVGEKIGWNYFIGESLTGGLECIVIGYNRYIKSSEQRFNILYKERIDYYILQGWLVSITEVRDERIIMTRKKLLLYSKVRKNSCFLIFWAGFKTF